MTFFTGCVIRVARREASRAIMMVISPAVATTVAHWQLICRLEKRIRAMVLYENGSANGGNYLWRGIPPARSRARSWVPPAP